MSRYRIPLFLLVGAAITFLPLGAYAAVSDFFGPIVEEDIQTCAAGWQGLIVVINNLVKFIISFGIIVAVLTITYAAFLLILSPTNPENRSKAKSLLINAAIGLLIALSAWLIVNTVIRAVTGNQSDISTFTVFLRGGDLCIKMADVGKPFPDEPGGTGGVSVVGNKTPVVGNEKTVRDRFAAAGVTVNNPNPCTGSQTTGCTSVGGMREATVQQVINIKNICGSARVSGGSEGGHSAGHSDGSKVDITGINSCITTTRTDKFFTAAGERSNGDKRYLDKCGNEYVYEEDGNPHWDITVVKTCVP